MKFGSVVLSSVAVSVPTTKLAVSSGTTEFDKSMALGGALLASSCTLLGSVKSIAPLPGLADSDCPACSACSFNTPIKPKALALLGSERLVFVRVLT